MLRLKPVPIWVAALAAACAVVACSEPITPDECTALLDRYTELLARAHDPRVSAERVLRMQQEARAKALASPEFARCTSRVPRRKWRCAMSAPTADEIERCLL